MKGKIITTAIAIQLLCGSLFSQANVESILARYQDEEFDLFYKYIASATFPQVSFERTGVLVAGMVLSSGGEILNVFCLNSIDATIDNFVLDHLELSAGNWKPDTSSTKPTIFVIPFIFKQSHFEYSIASENYKFPVMKELFVVRLPYSTSKRNATIEDLSKKYVKSIKARKFNETELLINELINREPFNANHYAKLLKYDLMTGNSDGACQIFKFIQSHFINQPEILVKPNCQ